jgi:hypothetical protein
VASSFAICFCHPKPSLIASSPTKIGEYLAAGLPVVSGPAVGDTDAILQTERIGAVVQRFTVEDYEQAAHDILAMSNDPEARRRSRDAAQRIFSLDEVGIPRYDRLYRELAALDHR